MDPRPESLLPHAAGVVRYMHPKNRHNFLHHNAFVVCCNLMYSTSSIALLFMGIPQFSAWITSFLTANSSASEPGH